VASRQYRYTTTPTSNDNDGRAKFVQDMTQQSSPFDRSYTFDHAGRLVSAQTGAAARGANFVDGPYSEVNEYDEWDQTTSLRRGYWNNDPTLSNLLTSTDESARARTPLWSYDADGRVVANDANQTFGYDAAGREVSATSQVTLPSGAVVTQTAVRGYDGDGRKVCDSSSGSSGYYLRSAALGGAVVTELGSTGQKTQSYVYAGGALLAAQTGGGVVWRQQAPLDMTEWDTDSSGNVLARAELDPEGADFGTSAPSQGSAPQ
jgi:hypothetical protein